MLYRLQVDQQPPKNQGKKKILSNLQGLNPTNIITYLSTHYHIFIYIYGF